MTGEADYAACRRIMETASHNYSYASRLLPAGKRRHVDALYAVMRVGDDRVDVGHAGFASAAEAIDDWQSAYDRAFRDGDSPDPVLRAYLRTSAECGIPADTLAPYFRAMREDLTTARYPSYADLARYMEGSALPVGRAMTRILGVRPPFTVEMALPQADCLSAAMQLSNFCRDVGQDWQLGRIYLPLEDLERFDYTEGDMVAACVDQRFVGLMDFQFRRIEELYHRARGGVAMLATGCWGVMAGLEIYHDILSAIRRNRYDVFHRRAAPGGWRRLGLAAVALARVAASRPGAGFA